jgi:AcrR family transcriptional regulator
MSTTPAGRDNQAGAASKAKRTDPRLAQTRSLILEAADELLISGGIAAVTIDAVSQRSGVARSTIYRHFKDRNDLLVFMFRSLDVQPDLPERGLELGERLVTALSQLAEGMAEPRWRKLTSVLLDPSQSAELVALASAIHDRQRLTFRTILEDAIADGDLPADTDVDEARMQLLAPLFSSMFTPEPGTLDHRRIVELFLESRSAQ